MGIERLERWTEELEMKKQYFGKRKNWARRIAEERILAAPGDTTKAKYWNREYEITVGPRGGLQIRGRLPWQDMNGWEWFQKRPAERKKG